MDNVEVSAITGDLPTEEDTSEPSDKKITSFMNHRSVPRRYSMTVKVVSMIAFTWAFAGYLNESVFFYFENPIWLNRYTEYAIIVAFGLWRIRAERNPYTRKRIIVLITCVGVLWWLIPWSFPFFEPYVGANTVQPVFPSLHIPGTITFFVVLIAVFLFGRRVICAWSCPCVGIRDTVGFVFRNKTPRGKWAWRMRHTKWFFFALYVISAVIIIFYTPNADFARFLGIFTILVILPYFITFFLSPFLGNRSYCRYLCPYGATFGILNKVGFYRIDYNESTCIDCGLCEKVCDMGIPVVTMGKKYGKVSTTECMGCGRCITECPSKSLAFKDARNLLFPSLHMDKDRLKGIADIRSPAFIRRAVIFAFFIVSSLVISGHFNAAIGTAAELPNEINQIICAYIYC